MQEVATTVWTLGVQLGTSLLIAIFFLLLSRSQPLVEVRVWTLAWLAELAAVGAGFVTVLIDYPSGAAPTGVGRLLMVIFCAGKTSYALLVVRGARFHAERGFLRASGARGLLLFVAGWALALGLLAPEARIMLTIQWLLVALVLIAGAIGNLRHPRPGRSRWLGWVLLGEGLLYLHYVPPMAPVIWGRQPLYGIANYSSLLDAAADLLLALAILVALAEASSARLRDVNRRLEASQEKLRQLVDLDPLTGLRNRRGLRPVLEHLSAVGGVVIFLDIDDFKRLNDGFGHLAGDACLVELGNVLSRSFRPEDAVFRWGGDEFLVVAAGMETSAAEARIAAVRRALADNRALPGFRVSVGMAALLPGADPATVLRRADERMFADKGVRPAVVESADRGFDRMRGAPE